MRDEAVESLVASQKLPELFLPAFVILDFKPRDGITDQRFQRHAILSGQRSLVRTFGYLDSSEIERFATTFFKRGVVHSKVMLPAGAPEAWSDRERLWNDVEAFEVRRDAQLAREVEFAIPREMTQAQGIELARDFVQAEFVDQGMPMPGMAGRFRWL